MIKPEEPRINLDSLNDDSEMFAAGYRSASSFLHEKIIEALEHVSRYDNPYDILLDLKNYASRVLPADGD